MLVRQSTWVHLTAAFGTKPFGCLLCDNLIRFFNGEILKYRESSDSLVLAFVSLRLTSKLGRL